MNPILEAVCVQRDLALLAEEDGLVVLVAVQRALLAVAPLGLTVLANLCPSNPVVEAIKPSGT
jgi:hypothetical protein